MIRARRARRLESGQTLVEFALSIPFFLLVLVSIMYLGRVFYTKQVLLMAAQEGARASCRVPNLNDPSVRDQMRGFTVSGQATNTSASIYKMLAGAKLLSQNDSGDLPPGSSVKILPWDDPSISIPDGTMAVRIDYPFKFVSDPFNGQSNFGTVEIYTGEGGGPLRFEDFLISESAVVSQEIYQEVN